MKFAQLGLFLCLLSSATAFANLTQQLQEALNKSSSLNNNTCVDFLKDLDSQVRDVDWSKYSNQELAQMALADMDLSWKLRLSLHSLLTKVDAHCALEMREVFHSLRDMEDYLAEFGYPDIKPIEDVKSVDFDNEPTPVRDTKFYKPYYSTDDLKNKEFQFRTGDIMLARGVSFISPTIAQLTDNQSQYSHVVFVHIDDTKKPPVEQTIESYVNVGVSSYDMTYALRNENSRLLILRAKDSQLAKQAADELLFKVNEAKMRGELIPYDYKMDFNEHSAMSCAETVRAGFEWASKGKVILPTYSANISLNNPKFLADLGIPRGPIFTPDDLEVDPNFDMILDWRDYRLIRDSRYKDAILAEMMIWLGSMGYNFHDTLKSDLTKYVLWPLRETPFVWPAIKKIASSFNFKVPNLDHNIPRSTVAVMTVLGEVGTTLLDEIRASDAAYRITYHRSMDNKQLRAKLEEIRKDDLEKYKKGQKTLFHEALRPDSAQK